MSIEFTGYPIMQEDREGLKATSTAFEHVVSYSLPQRRAVENWLRTENQGQVGRCGGMANANANEVNYWLKTGKIIQFNGHYSYIRAQQYTPTLYGRDQGSTISANLKASMEKGLCPTGEGDYSDQSWKYSLPPNYTTQIPAGADERAAAFKVGSHTWLTSGDQLRTYLHTNMGAIMVGAAWGYWQPDSDGYVRRFRGGGGGHAWSIVDWLDDGTPIAHNSHGSNYGKRGFFYLTDEFLDGLFRDAYTSVVGVSDLTVPVPRKADWLHSRI